jgi:phage repressor protein C with HTH and peptisase S24 domain
MNCQRETHIGTVQNAGMALDVEKPAAAQRLEQARITRGFKTAKDAAAFFGWPYATYAQHESGERGIGRQSAKYAVAFRVSEGWLLTGEGPEPVNDAGDPLPAHERTKGQPVLYVPREEIVAPGRKLEVYVGAQGGNGKMIIGSDIVDRVEMPAVLKDVQGAYGILIDGESMQPEYWPGDIAWVHPHLRPARGRNHIFYHTPPEGVEAEAIIKRLNDWNDRAWHLEQWNPHKQFDEFRKEWPICHRVVGKYDAA